jgi:hypothetical protein
VIDRLLGHLHARSVWFCDDGNTHTHIFEGKSNGNTICPGCGMKRSKSGRVFVLLDPLAEGGVLRLWCQSKKMGHQMLYLAHTLRNKKAAAAAPPGPQDAAPPLIIMFADGERAKQFAELIEKNPTLFLFAYYFDHFVLDVKKTKSGGVISLIPLFFDPNFKTSANCFSFSSFSSVYFVHYMLNSRGMNEIPIAFFPPARTAEQAQNKLYDSNRFMSYVYEIIHHGFKGEQVCHMRLFLFSLLVYDCNGLLADSICFSRCNFEYQGE